MMCWFSVIVLCFPLLVFANHGHWTDHYQSVTGTPCCGVKDCVKTSMRMLDRTEETVTIEIPHLRTVITIPRQSYHISEDEHDYWCAVIFNHPPTAENTRCVFIVVGS